MKTLYLECGMGCAGDMLMAALSELVDQKAFVEKMNTIGLENVEFRAVPSMKCGIYGTHMEVRIFGEEEHSHDDHTASFSYHLQNVTSDQKYDIMVRMQKVEGIHQLKMHGDNLSYQYDHDHSGTAENALRQIVHDVDETIIVENMGHKHSHSHHEHGVGMHDIHHILASLHVSDAVKEHAEAVYQLIAEAESHAHHMPMEHIHFHEVGTMDAIADVVGNCVLMEMIGAKRILASPVAVGSGKVRCAHGVLPVPAPATAYLLQGVPTYSGRFQGELCTPTGAALLKHFVSSFESQPVMVTEKIGYGMGTKDFEAANCVRAFLGEMEEDGEITELACTIDDQSGEEIGYAIDQLFANGALDVYTTPVQMKKNRPGIVLTCACRNHDTDKMLKVMFENLTTLGIRQYRCKRHALSRHIETIDTDFGNVRIKYSHGYGVNREKLEFDDLSRIAKENHMSIAEVRKQIQKGIK